jgi:hypothetical protein
VKGGLTAASFKASNTSGRVTSQQFAEVSNVRDYEVSDFTLLIYKTLSITLNKTNLIRPVIRLEEQQLIPTLTCMVTCAALLNHRLPNYLHRGKAMVLYTKQEVSRALLGKVF